MKGLTQPPASLVALMVVAACAGSKVDDETGPDTAGAVFPFFSAAVTLDGADFAVGCTAETADYLFYGFVAGGSSFLLNCTDPDSQKMLQVWSTDGVAGTWTDCGTNRGAWLVDASDTTADISCRDGEVSTFSLEVTTLESADDGSVTWGGSFAMAGATDGHDAQVDGEFYAVLAPTE